MPVDRFAGKWRSFAASGLVVLALVLTAADSSSAIPGQAETRNGIPRLVDLGADKCIPCKMMAPILDELKTEYTGRMEVVFIDVWKREEEAQRYGVKMIPTQIFYGADGRELYRHMGFIGKEEILATWKRLGYDLQAK